MKILRFIENNILFLLTLFLLAFIPLYPKLPLVGVTHTWVYVRLEDFAVALTVTVWAVLLILKKVSLKTPLTIPIMVFWIIGGITTLHGVLILFPTLANVFSNVAFLSFLRRIEYMSLFFIAFTGIKDKKFVVPVAITLTAVLLLVIGYGFGQKYFGFPAFLTMNEEFAKGIPIRLSDLSRVPSTFAGQYDLAAYLVLIVPLLASLIFGIKNLILKAIVLITSVLGFVLLFMTVSRISFFALLAALLLLLILQKKKIIIVSLLVLTLLLLIISPSLLQRFKSTVSEVNVLVDARTGGAIGEVKEVPAEYFKNKVVQTMATATDTTLTATSSGVLPYELIPPIVPLVVEANRSNGETLPQGTSYVNLPLAPIVKKVDGYFSQKISSKNGVETDNIRAFYGDFLIKKAKAYDLSFTTRFQGEWPNTFDAFKRNIFLGSGYGSVSLAVDNNYLRILGESGLLGLFSFISIFIIAFIFIKNLLPKIDSPLIRSFVIGFVAGSFGLAVNATLIDVFEASKIAFTYWMLMGITIGILNLYKKEEIDLFKEFKKALTSPVAVVIYISILVGVFFYPLLSNYFVGDDFTWFRWTQECCGNIATYFTQANGFFYRPGTKIYFSLMYSGFWLNQTMYHLVSILLHFAVSVLLFFNLRKILKNYTLSIIAVVLFIILSAHHEDIFWISSTGFLFNAFFALTGLLSYVYYKEKKKIIYLIISLLSIIFSLIFHEIGVIVPLLIILYDAVFVDKAIAGGLSRKINYLILLSPLLPYLALRYLAQSHWSGGDYSYNLIKLPYNVLGNTIGYLLLDLFGVQSLSFYETFRNLLKNHILLAVPAALAVILIFIGVYRLMINKLDEKDRKIAIFGCLFFLIALLPFLGLGNIASRYSYLSSIGFVILLGLFSEKIFAGLINLTDKRIGTALMIIVAIVYLMVQSFDLQKLHSDWAGAGDKTQNLLVSIQEYSKDAWIRQPMQFYFVNPPIRQGEAWVWPVGLSDALWLTFKNPKISVDTTSDINSALNKRTISSNVHVFRFDSQGGVDEVVRGKNGQINLLNPPR